MATELFALNLTMSEMIVCLFDTFSMSYNLLCVYIWSAVQFFSGFLIAAQPLFQCCVCGERYLAVVNPCGLPKVKTLQIKGRNQWL